MLLFAITNALNDVEAVLVPLLARITLKMTAEQYGLMTSFFGIGTVTGIFLVGILGNHIRFRALLICGSMALFGGAIIAMGLAQEAIQLYGAYFVFGLSYIVADIVSLTLWMQLIPESLRGRVFSTIAALAMALNPLGFVLASVLGNIYGIRTGIWIGGGLVVLSGLLALLFRSVRNLDHQAKSVFSTESE